MTVRRRARRMAPQERCEQILDSAVRLITTGGNPNCTLEQVAAAAGVSKPLIYKYFPNREELLKALVERELRILRGHGLGKVPKDVPLEKVIRNTVARALRYYSERGPVLRLLAGDPAVADLVSQGNRAILSTTLDYFIERSVETYGISEDVARIAVAMVTNAPVLTMRYLRRREIPVEHTVDVWGTFIQGGWNAVEARFGGKPAAPIKPRRKARMPARSKLAKKRKR